MPNHRFLCAAMLLLSCTGTTEGSNKPPAGGPTRPDSGTDSGTTDSGTTDSGTTDSGATDPQDILTTDIALDLQSLTGRATILVQPAEDADQVVLDVSGLSLTSVAVGGVVVTPTTNSGMAMIPVTPNEAATLVIDYTFMERTFATFDGWMPELGVSFIWPDYCANLFPCDPAMRDGVTFTMSVSGLEPGQTAIYPSTTTTDAPAYMPGIAVGTYDKRELGTTSNGTRVSVWYFPDLEIDADIGTANLTDAVDFFEQTYGPYAFGPEVGAVSVDWGSDSYGGMEHHPFFHVGKFDFWNEEAHVHEAAHAWFGDGVRIECWEDFVLSEGTVTYLAAHSLEELGGYDLWPGYVDYFLVPICTGLDVNAVVLPETCNEIDFENDNLWSLATYMKGACFYEEVADQIGADRLDEVIQEFYAANVNGTARMQEMIDLIKARAEPEDEAVIDQLVDEWLKTLDCPQDYATRCSAHQR